MEEKEIIEKSAYNPLFQGCRSVDEYQRLNYISQGTYGVVFRAKCRKTGELYALKQVKLSAESNKVGFPISALRETNILMVLSHPNIMNVKEMVVGSSTDKVYMVMEYCDNDLKYCMEQSKYPFSTSEVKRDLKTSNLLYSNKGLLKVCDFGMARKYGSPIAPYTNEVVTLWYRPPELLLGSTTYSTPLDIWSVACIFAEMLTGKPLFPGEGEIDQMNKIFRLLGAPTEESYPSYNKLPHASKVSWRAPSKGKLREFFPSVSFSGGVYLNDTGFSLLTQLLSINPSQRISASSALSHPWLLTEEPLAAPYELMPKFRSRHETEE
eukprot:gene19445-25325_t